MFFLPVIACIIIINLGWNPWWIVLIGVACLMDSLVQAPVTVCDEDDWEIEMNMDEGDDDDDC